MDELNIEMNRIFVDHVLESDADIIWQIGGRFSGKSFGMEQLASMNLATKPDYKLLVIEDKEGNVNQGTKAGILARMKEFQYTPMFSDTKKPAEINSRTTDNMALFKGYTTEDQVKQVKALNQVTSIWYEEAEKVTKDQVEDLYFQLRGGNPEDRKLYLTLNPVDDGCYANKNLIQTDHDEVLEYFEDGKRPKVFVKYVTTEYIYKGKKETATLKHLVVLTTHHDNIFLENKQRAAIEAMKATDYEKWQQLAEARFIRPSGVFFNGFDKDVTVIEPFAINKNWDRYVSIDYGRDMFAVGWYAVDNYGMTYLYRVLDVEGLIISAAAEALIEANGNEKIRYFYAPVDLWNARQETGKNVAELFKEYGIRLTKANNDRIAGALAMKELLNVYETVDIETGEAIKESKLRIFNTCTSVVRSLKELLKDKLCSDKYAKEPHDITHAADQLRYFATGRQKPTKVKKYERPKANTHQRLKSWNGYN